VKTHVELVGLLHLVAGALGLLLGASLLVLGAGAASIAWAHHGEMAASVTALVMILVAGLVLGWGVASLWTGGALRRHRPWSRLVALAMAILNLFILPFGTALGVYTLWVLLQDQARALFDPPAPAR